MGLFKELALLPVAPLRFTVWVAEQVADEADRQQYGVGAGAQQLDRIEEARKQGELEEEEAEDLEGRVIEGRATPARPSADREEGRGDG
jgi:RPA family protein